MFQITAPKLHPHGDGGLFRSVTVTHTVFFIDPQEHWGIMLALKKILCPNQL